MPGGSRAVSNGKELAQAVTELAKQLGLEAKEQVKVARRIWGSERYIDVVLTDPNTHKRLGVECKFQEDQGSAEEKIPTTIDDISAWPIPGIVVFAGDGFSANMKSFLISTGKAVQLKEL